MPESTPAPANFFTALRTRIGRSWLFKPERRWPGRRALVPVDLCYTVLDLFTLLVFFTGLTSVVMLYLTDPTAILAFLGFHAIGVFIVPSACATLCRGLPFNVRFALSGLALFVYLVAGMMEVGVMPTATLGAFMLLIALSLFYGLRAGLVGLGLFTAVSLATAWGWTHGHLPLSAAAEQSTSRILDYRSPLVWARVLVNLVLHLVVLLTLMHFMLRRLRDSLRTSDQSLRLLAMEQEQRAVAEIEQSRHRTLFRTLFESANDAVFLMDQRGFLSCNPRTEVMFGCRREEIVGHSPAEFSPPCQPDGRASADKARELMLAASAGRSQNFEWQHQRRDGTRFDCEISLSRLEFERETRLLAIVRDITERKQAQAALQQSEAFRQRMFESSRTPIVVLDAATWQFVDLNPAAVEIYRFSSREATLGRPPIDVSAPVQYDGTPSAEKVRYYIGEARAKGSIVFEWRHQRPDGEIWDAEVHLMSFQSGGRQFLQFTLQDITERRRMAEALSREKRFFEALFEAMPGNAFVIDEHGRYLRWNRNFERCFGVTKDDVEKGLSILDTIHPKDRERVGRALLAGATAGFGEVEYLSVGADGVATPRFATGQSFEWDGRRYGVGVSLDISKRVKAETALRMSEERYRQITQCMPDLIWTVDAAGRFTYANSAVERTHGWTVADFLGLPIWEVNTPRQAEKTTAMFEAEVRKVLLPGYDRNTVYRYESEERRKDGTVFMAEVAAAFMWSDEGQPFGLIGITRDITERKRAEAERQGLQTQLIQAQKMEAVGQLAGGVAHDFNNILTAILMHLDMLKGDDRVPVEVKVALGELEDAAHRATSLTRQLLMFSRRQVAQKQLLDLDSLVGNLIKMLRRLIGEHISLEFTGSNARPWLVADGGMLEQVVMNLVVNARDAMPEGGRITLTTSLVDFDAAALRSRPDIAPGRFVCLTVADTGSGMSAETQRHIFEPFFTTKESGKGTGLGLATVYGIVQQHQGWIEVESQLAAGTAFRVYLPASAPEAPRTARTEPAATLAGGQETILVAEDDPAVRDLTCLVLQRAGYQVLAAATGEEAAALWAVRKGQVDLLLTDMIMPGGLTGLELIRRFRKDHPALKAILMSGYNPESSQQGLPADRIIYLAKPYEVSELARAVRQCFQPG